ncbi:MAG: ThuA domain-containing protein [Oscillospiraceae bacterium]|jgi:type 1 glutamine amidotransferase|nr:ThuA domain-containing protein [Oscillospiraceae bacterium]
MASKKALIFYGGWDGHEPALVANRFRKILEARDFDVEMTDTLEPLADANKLNSLNLLVPCWTGHTGGIPREASSAISEAVGAGVGVAGCHGGMCDTFRSDTQWQFITGGQWVSHPGGDGIEYTVNVRRGTSPLVDGIEDFQVTSEHYYLHIDPSVEVLATTRFPQVTYYHNANKPVDMPVVWTKYWGLGRVFYCSLGHHDDVFDTAPQAQTLMERGLLWAAGGKEYAKANGLTVDRYLNTAKMY